MAPRVQVQPVLGLPSQSRSMPSQRSGEGRTWFWQVLHAVPMPVGSDAQVCVPESTQWPDFDMPAALRIEQIPMTGPAQVVLDNEAAILATLATQQAGVQCLSDADTTGTGTEGTGTSTSTSAGDEVAADESETAPTYDLPYDTTCGCATTREQAPLAIGLGLVVLGSIAPRRRRA